jgi:hypothetical protein
MTLDTRREAAFAAAELLRPGDGLPASTLLAYKTGCSIAGAALQAHSNGAHIITTGGAKDGTTAAPPVGMHVSDMGYAENSHYHKKNGLLPEAMTMGSVEHWVAVAKNAHRGGLSMEYENGEYAIGAPSFTTLVHRSVVARGKWMYEVTLHSDGLMQLGWSPPHDLVEWSPKLGVGDFLHTMAYDGSRRKLWKLLPRDSDTAKLHGPAAAPGKIDTSVNVPAWCEGDVITLCADLDAGVATFYSNGDLCVTTSMPSLARAPRDDPDSMPLYAMCAAVTVGTKEGMSINLGDAPFAYPQTGFSGISWMRKSAAASTATSNPPPFLRAHVAAEILGALASKESNGEITPQECNRAVARLLSGVDAAALTLLGAALGTTLLRPTSMDELREPSSPTSVRALIFNDVPICAAADVVVHRLNVLLEYPGPVFRSLLNALGNATRQVTLDIPSRRNQNRRARVALRVAAHLVKTHFQSTHLCDEWPAPEGARLERDLAPFSRPRFATPEMQEELIPEVDLMDPLAAPELREIAHNLGNDLYHHIQPFREAIFEPLIKHRPAVVTALIHLALEKQDAQATAGTMLFALLAGIITKHAKFQTDDELVATYASRGSLASERGAKLEAKRLGGSVQQLLRVASTQKLIKHSDAGTSNPLLISVAYLFHAAARRQLPGVISQVADLRHAVNELKKEGSSDPEKLIDRINDLTRNAVLARGRMAHEWLVDVLFAFASVLGRIFYCLGNRALLARAKTDKNYPEPVTVETMNVFRAGRDLIVHAQISEDTIDYLLLPAGFITSISLICQMCRRSMPLAFSARLQKMPYLVRFAIHGALSPIVEPSEVSESLIQLASLMLDPPGPDPIPHGRALADVLRPEDVALLASRCFSQMQNDIAWSASVNLLATLSAGAGLAHQRSHNEPTSHGWLMWDGERESGDIPVAPHQPMDSVEVVRAGIHLLHSAEKVKELSASVESEQEKQKRAGCDFAKGFKFVVQRSSWLLSEFGVAAQDELANRGTQQTRNRMSVIFDLLQRNLHTIEFLLENAGDMLLTRTETEESATGAIPVVVQQVVELLVLLFRDYGRSDSLMYKVLTLPHKELQNMHPYRLISPLFGILLTLLRPDDNITPPTLSPVNVIPMVKASAAISTLDELVAHQQKKQLPPPSPACEDRFSRWKRVFHRMFKSPRCGWDVRHIEFVAQQFPLPELIREKRVVGPADKVLWYLATEEWMPTLRDLYEKNKYSSLSPSAAAKKKLAKKTAADDNVLTLLGAGPSCASIDDLEDPGLCPICFVDPINVEFKPCGHHSCRACIERQLQGQQKRCFFCNAAVVEVEPFNPNPANLPPSRPGSAMRPAKSYTSFSTPTSSRANSMFPATLDGSPQLERQRSMAGSAGGSTTASPGPTAPPLPPPRE